MIDTVLTAGKTPFDQVKGSIDLALEEIKKQNYELYLHLKESIKMDEIARTFCYMGNYSEY